MRPDIRYTPSVCVAEGKTTAGLTRQCCHNSAISRPACTRNMKMRTISWLEQYHGFCFCFASITPWRNKLDGQKEKKEKEVCNKQQTAAIISRRARQLVFGGLRSRPPSWLLSNSGGIRTASNKQQRAQQTRRKGVGASALQPPTRPPPN